MEWMGTLWFLVVVGVVVIGAALYDQHQEAKSVKLRRAMLADMIDQVQAATERIEAMRTPSPKERERWAPWRPGDTSRLN